SGTATSPSRSAGGGSLTSTTTCWTAWSRIWASPSRPASPPSNPRPAVTGTATATGSTNMSTDTSTGMDTSIEGNANDVPTTDVVPVAGVALTRLLQLV